MITHNFSSTGLLGLGEFEFDDTLAEEDTTPLPLTVAWCGGTRKRGCGNKFNLLTVKREGDFFVCPHCGRLN
jgi:hypothetical protein